MIPVLLTLLLLLKAPQSSALAGEAMQAAIRQVLPVLIPYCILSRMILAHLPASSGAHGRILTAYLTGAVCGAPVGAGLLAKLTEDGTLDRKEAERLLPSVCHTSPAFCAAVIGQTVGSTAVGAAMWCFSVLLGLPGLLSALKRAGGRTAPAFTGPGGLGDAIRASSIMAGNVLCSILFFYTLSGTLMSWLRQSGLPAAIVSSLLEVSSGVLAAAALPAEFRCAVAAFAAVFGGLCVCAQVRAAVPGVSVLPSLIRKLTAGVIAAVLFYAFPSFFELFP